MDAGAQFTITIDGVNDPPSFALSNTSEHSQEDQGLVTVTGFVQNASTGPPDEVNQTATFTVTCIPDSLFMSNGFPSIYPNGTMTYEAKADTSGSATCG